MNWKAATAAAMAAEGEARTRSTTLPALPGALAADAWAGDTADTDVEPRPTLPARPRPADAGGVAETEAAAGTGAGDCPLPPAAADGDFLAAERGEGSPGVGSPIRTLESPTASWRADGEGQTKGERSLEEEEEEEGVERRVFGIRTATPVSYRASASMPAA
jgi:hypothetical protein